MASRATTRLLHLRLPAPTSYYHAADIQNALLRLHLDHKAKSSGNSFTSDAPPPLFLTTQFHPIYTLGRREQLKDVNEEDLPAPIHRSNRGGQTTFHGPGQCVGYLICDLQRHSIRPRCFIRQLENAAMATLSSHGLKAFTTNDPGVWVDSGRKKIASVGVALRRYISTHGIAINVKTDLSYFDSIIACGLPGVKTTSMAEEGHDANVEDVATEMASRLAESLQGVEGVQEIEEDEVKSWTAASAIAQ